MSNAADVLRSCFEQELKKLKQFEKDKEKSVTNRQQLEGQLTENVLVKEELDRLESEDVVYKLVGPVLVPQDLAEARQNIGKRIEYISAEIRRLEESLKDTTAKETQQKEALMKMQGQLQTMQMKRVQ